MTPTSQRWNTTRAPGTDPFTSPVARAMRGLGGTRLWKLCTEADGQDLVEYAVLTSLISLVSVGVVGALGVSVATVFNTIGAQLGP